MSQRNGKRAAGADYIGFVLFLLGAILAVIVAWSMRVGYGNRMLAQIAKFAVEGMGRAPVLLLSIGTSYLGVRVFLNGRMQGLRNNLSGVVGASFTLAFMLGALSETAGGAVGGLNGSLASVITTIPALILGLAAFLSVIWFSWLREFPLFLSRKGKTDRVSVALTEAVAERAEVGTGVSNEEAEALLPDVNTITADLEQVRQDGLPAWAFQDNTPPPYPEDPRLTGEVPSGAQPLASDVDESPVSPSTDPALHRWTPERAADADDAPDGDLVESASIEPPAVGASGGITEDEGDTSADLAPQHQVASPLEGASSSELTRALLEQEPATPEAPTAVLESSHGLKTIESEPQAPRPSWEQASDTGDEDVIEAAASEDIALEDIALEDTALEDSVLEDVAHEDVASAEPSQSVNEALEEAPVAKAEEGTGEGCSRLWVPNAGADEAVDALEAELDTSSEQEQEEETDDGWEYQEVDELEGEVEEELEDEEELEASAEIEDDDTLEDAEEEDEEDVLAAELEGEELEEEESELEEDDLEEAVALEAGSEGEELEGDEAEDDEEEYEYEYVEVAEGEEGYEDAEECEEEEELPLSASEESAEAEEGESEAEEGEGEEWEYEYVEVDELEEGEEAVEDQEEVVAQAGDPEVDEEEVEEEELEEDELVAEATDSPAEELEEEELEAEPVAEAASPEPEPEPVAEAASPEPELEDEEELEDEVDEPELETVVLDPEPAEPVAAAETEDSTEPVQMDLFGSTQESPSEEEPVVVIQPQAPALAIASKEARAAADLILQESRVAVSMLQKKFKLDFKASCVVLDELQDLGFLGPYIDGKHRDILMTREEWLTAAGDE